MSARGRRRCRRRGRSRRARAALVAAGTPARDDEPEHRRRRATAGAATCRTGTCRRRRRAGGGRARRCSARARPRAICTRESRTLRRASTTPASTTTSNAKESGLAASVRRRADREASAASLLQRPDRRAARTRCRARTGTLRHRRCPPRAQRTMRPERRADAPPLPARRRVLNASAAVAIDASARILDAEERGQRVVEQAVRDERVAARVPEVVPEREAVLEQERALVRVRCPVDARRAEPDAEARQASRRGRPRSSPPGQAACAPKGSYPLRHRQSRHRRYLVASVEPTAHIVDLRDQSEARRDHTPTSARRPSLKYVLRRTPSRR